MALQLGSNLSSAGSRLGAISGLLIPITVVVLLLGSALGTIATGNVGVRTTLGVMSQDEVTPGLYIRWPLISRVDEFTAKEIAIDLTDLNTRRTSRC